MWWALLGALAGAAAPPPSDHTIVYYNARMALREGDPVEAVKLWLLRNALEDQTGRVSPYDADFGSVTWAALGELGLCQDGQPNDDDGAGLWPLALHNWVVRNMGRRARGKRANPYNAFEVGRQARTVSITDVLSASELSAVQLSRGWCLRPRLALVAAGESVTARLSDRQVAARRLRHLLVGARDTLAGERVRGRSVIEARLFDLDLQITALAAREARVITREATQRGRTVAASSASLSAMRAEAPSTTLDHTSAAAGVLRASAEWSVDEWMALAPDRRLYLFEAARSFVDNPEHFIQIGLGVLGALIDAGDGAGAARWIGPLAPADGDVAAREGSWGGARGQRLLALDPDAGFDERAVVALHRGTDQLARGDLPAALRSMALARQRATESQSAPALAGLSLRWLTYVAAQFEITADLLVTLQELVPRRDYAVLLEDLMWSAAFHADRRSFETGMDNQVGRGALERRLSLLQPLASGDVGGFARRIRAGLGASQSETLRFLDQLVERLELEDLDVRTAQLPTLRALQTLLDPLASAEEGRQGRVAADVVDRCLAIEQGISGLPADATARDRARALDPGGEVFAGSVRLAPADPLPWPFRPSDTPAPSVFLPIDLSPVEWRDAAGDLVFGWSIEG